MINYNYIGIEAPDRKSLLIAVDNIIKEKSLKVGKLTSYVVIDLKTISRRCGKVDYKTKKDIPADSVKCNCKKHWFIKYRDEN